ncbi:MAG: ABC transporter ATP-binding protein [Lachnospiraceae bacterium]|nr:ABC transporter ATP-binding protein [Lachnospiraceae bacterium]
MSLLEVKNLTISYGGGAPAAKDVTFSLEPGRILSIVGESGSGKSTVIRGILGLLSGNGQITGGEILFDGKDLRKMSKRQMQKLRGEDIAMIFQDAGLAMDPIQTIGRQFVEYIQTHKDLSNSAAKDLAKEWLLRMNLNDPQRVMESYPFELSGGMKQRAAIAMAMAQNPKLLLADEPTSALDVTVQAQVVYELQKLTEQYDTAIIMVTHNMGVASYLSHDILVMKTGEVVEYGSREQVIFQPQSDYTKMLLAAVPKLERPEEELRGEHERNEELLAVKNVVKEFAAHHKKQKGVVAVNGAEFSLFKGECLGIVGESGCGKSTLARMIIGSYPPTEGEITLQGKQFADMRAKEQKNFRRHVQMVFQNPISSFSPRMTIGDYLYEPLKNYEKMSRSRARERIEKYMTAVGLPMEFLGRHPHELSGGQLQRVVIARAALLEPDLIVCDEATSALDVSIQNQVADMLVDLQRQWHLSYMFIGHDLALVRQVSHRIIVMYRGEIVEVMNSKDLTTDAAHPYTQVLLEAVFDVYEDREERRKLLERNANDSREDVPGCKFAPRCRYATERCREEDPKLREIGEEHFAACHRLAELTAAEGGAGPETGK